MTRKDCTLYTITCVLNDSTVCSRIAYCESSLIIHKSQSYDVACHFQAGILYILVSKPHFFCSRI